MKRKLEKLLKKYGMENRTLRGIWLIHMDKSNKKYNSAKKVIDSIDLNFWIKSTKFIPNLKYLEQTDYKIECNRYKTKFMCGKKDTWELCYCLAIYNYFKLKMKRSQNVSEV